MIQVFPVGGWVELDTMHIPTRKMMMMNIIKLFFNQFSYSSLFLIGLSNNNPADAATGKCNKVIYYSATERRMASLGGYSSPVRPPAVRRDPTAMCSAAAKVQHINNDVTSFPDSLWE